MPAKRLPDFGSLLLLVFMVVLLGAMAMPALAEREAGALATTEPMAYLPIVNHQRLDECPDDPDPPCFDNNNRYVDCSNGTVNDTVTNLIWLKNANCYGGLDYAAANNAAAGLEHGECGLSDGSSPGDWRLPTKEEWEATVAPAVALGCEEPSLTSTWGNRCYSAGSKPFTGVHSARYWSSTAYEGEGYYAWSVSLYGGVLDYHSGKHFPYYVWPVRGGQ